jgi:site-specific recombinase XerD
MSNLLAEKGVNYESIQCIKNLVGLSPNQFEKNTYRSYSVVMAKFCAVFGGHQLSELTTGNVMDFLNQLTDGCKPQTKRIRFAHLAAFFNFIKNNLISDLVSPCDSKMLRKRKQ